MPVPARQIVYEGMELLPPALKPFVEQRLESALQGHWQARVAEKLPGLRQTKGGQIKWDLLALLNAMDRLWTEAFKVALDRAERAIVNELVTVRNKHAHDEAFSYDDAERALDSMRRLMEAISAGDVAADLGKKREGVLRTRFAEQRRSEERRGARQQEIAIGAASGLQPWCTVVEPHADVASGEFQLAEFAADLAQVNKGDAPLEYRDPKEFFSRTYLTAGLSALLVDAAKRLSGAGGDPVVELQTNFGGGKTHSLLALYHATAGVPAQELPGVDQLLSQEGLGMPGNVNRAVLVGTSRQPHDPFKPKGGPSIYTIWGELAWQLGGKKTFALVADHEAKGVTPGADLLIDMFKQCAPSLILIDEWVAYLRSLYKVDGLPSGSFDTNLSFVQAVTEAVKRSPQTLLLASLPASKTEAGAEGGQEALARLRQTFGRVESPWRPASREESYEIVRRRLFKEIPGDKHPPKDNTLKQFAKLYRENQNDFPVWASEGDYLRKFEKSYPIHPDLFDQLFTAWSSLEKFQRTRGMLRLMAKVIHERWMSEDPFAVIMPGSVNVGAAAVETELRNYLDDAWQAIISADVDGADSIPYTIDKSAPSLTRYSATRRVARAVFMGTAPMPEGGNQGIDDKQINLGVVQPGEKTAVFGDALRRLANQARFMHSDQGRYWYSMAQSINRVAADRANQLDDALVLAEIDKALANYINGIGDRGHFDAVQVVAEGSADVPDESNGVRLAVLGVASPHHNGGDSSAALVAAKTLLQQRGSAQRVYRNTMVFLAADRKQIDNLKSAMRLSLGWQWVVQSAERLDLRANEKRRAEHQAREALDTMKTRLKEAWSWLLYPYQDEAGDKIPFTASRVTTQDGVLARASSKLVSDGALMPELGPANLALELTKHLWQGKDHLLVKDLWEYLNRFIYLPRVKGQATLIKSVQAAVGDMVPGPFAYAEGWDEQAQRYRGLVCDHAPNTPVTIDGESLLVRAEVAAAARQAAGQTVPAAPPSQPSPGGGGQAQPTGPRQPAAGAGAAQMRRFYGTAPLDPITAKKDFNKIVDEVVQHFTTMPNAEVNISVEIQAQAAAGFDETKQRTVRENSNVLGFKSAEFEEGE